jgi:methyltransferase-like protein/cyclopropane fatty-acyl-phospholipid synthase-like methyltransferase
MSDQTVMSDLARTLYDDVPYPSGLYPQTHPDRLATNAILFGMHPACVERSRVLELGCNDGTNLIAMAYVLPESQFIGVDLAGQAIASGNEVIEKLGLKNISLRHMDLLEFPAELGRFDYIIAHGLYSWVSQAVRDKLLAVCGMHLTESGVAFVSYNVYPGAHFRDLTRGMMRYHAAKFPDVAQKIVQARALLKALADSKEEPEPYHLVLRSELERAAARSDAALFHDDLNAINQPVYFHQFIEHAARHGLQYLSEADLRAMQVDSYRGDVTAQLDKLDPAGLIRREQYIDFLKCRRFRQTLLCRNGITLERSIESKRLYGLRCAANLTSASGALEAGSPSPKVFRNPAGAELQTDRPVVKAALMCLATAWPQSVSFEALLNSSKTEFGSETVGERKMPEDLAAALLQAHLAGYVEIHSYRAPFVTGVSERPTASALARLQLEKNRVLSTLRHQSIKVDDDLSRNLIRLLDGSRDRSAVLAELSTLIKSGSAVLRVKDAPVSDVTLALTQLSDGLEQNLTAVARLGLLIA